MNACRSASTCALSVQSRSPHAPPAILAWPPRPRPLPRPPPDTVASGVLKRSRRPADLSTTSGGTTGRTQRLPPQDDLHRPHQLPGHHPQRPANHHPRLEGETHRHRAQPLPSQIWTLPEAQAHRVPVWGCPERAERLQLLHPTAARVPTLRDLSSWTRPTATLRRPLSIPIATLTSLLTIRLFWLTRPASYADFYVKILPRSPGTSARLPGRKQLPWPRKRFTYHRQQLTARDGPSTRTTQQTYSDYTDATDDAQYVSFSTVPRSNVQYPLLSFKTTGDLRGQRERPTRHFYSDVPLHWARLI